MVNAYLTRAPKAIRSRTGRVRPHQRAMRTRDDGARASHKSSIFLRRIVGSMFMWVNSKCAHQVRPPLERVGGSVGLVGLRRFGRASGAARGTGDQIGQRVSKVFVSVIGATSGAMSQCLGHEDKCEDVVSDHGCDANQVDGVEASDGG